MTVTKRATATVNKHLAALADFYTWRGLGQPRASSATSPRGAPQGP